MARTHLFKNASVLAGPELKYVRDADIAVSNDTFEYVGPAGAYHGRDPRRDAGDADADAEPATHDCTGLLVIPGLVNCHTHIGDSVGKDARLEGTVDEKIHPVFGLKSRILSETPPDVLVDFMANSCASMVRGGTTTFVDFREGGVGGVALLRRALSRVPIRCVIMGRTNHYSGEDDIRRNAPLSASGEGELGDVVRSCDGLGVSGANENSDAVLGRYSECGTLRAIHASETEESVSRSGQMTGVSETVRALGLRPHFLVHMTHASKKDLEAVAGSPDVRGIVVCPRANAALAEGMPDIAYLRSLSNRRLALGTDNVMVNTPDMFREMDYTWKAAMGMGRAQVDPVEILRMATVNAGMILGRKIGQVAPGMLADCVFLDKHAIDLEPVHNPHAAVVHRASASSIRAVMIGGRMVHGSLD